MAVRDFRVGRGSIPLKTSRTQTAPAAPAALIALIFTFFAPWPTSLIKQAVVEQENEMNDLTRILTSIQEGDPQATEKL